MSTWSIQLLPFLEQSPLYDQIDHNVPLFQEAAALGYPAAAVQANQLAIQQPLPVFLCPSSATEMIYDCTLPANSGGDGVPPMDISWRAARSDYCISTGVRGDFSTLAYAGTNYSGSRSGGIQPGGLFGESRNKLKQFTDGTSNTILVAERVGGASVFRQRVRDANLSTLLGPTNGGGWGDILNGEHWQKGSLHDGNDGPDGGPCGINCTNLRGSNFYSFHPGGVHFVMADGHVAFVSENVAALVLASLITRARGEVLGEY